MSPHGREGEDQGFTAASPAMATRRMRRPERREQILTAATRAFSRTGFPSTSLDDIASEAGVSRVILYRHFESKNDLYRAALDRAYARLTMAVGEEFTDESVPELLHAAANDPDGFRLLFRYAVREPEFREQMERFGATSVAVTHRYLAELINEPAWARWAAQLLPTVAIEAVLAWLDAGQPDPGTAADRVLHAITGVIQAVQPTEPERKDETLP
jgi:AcrR family transcriptional regulator